MILLALAPTIKHEPLNKSDSPEIEITININCRILLMATNRTRSEPLYNNIWDHIKKNGKCKIAAHPAFHSRIVHAVVNKKYYDDGYRLHLTETNTYSKLVYVKGTNFIMFSLVVYDNFRNLKAGDI